MLKTLSVTLIAIVWCSALVHAAQQESMVLLLRSRSALPSYVSNVRFVVPDAVLKRRTTQQVMSARQQNLLHTLSRYIVVQVQTSDVNRLLTEESVETAWPLKKIGLQQLTLTNDSLSPQQYALQRIRAQQAWKVATGKGIRVAVIDTGIDWDHPDLRNQLAVNVAEDINKNGTFEPWPHTVSIDGRTGDLNDVDDDGNGYTDDVIGFDFVDQFIPNVGDDQHRDPIPADEQGHGTSVAGIIAGEANNHVGIAGLAYDARIVVLRSFDATGNADEDDIAAALVYAALNNVNIVNMSFGDGIDSPVLRDAIAFAAESGCLLVASAGNTGTISRQFPAGYNPVIAVGATNANDVRAVFSSTGSLLNLTAPGDGIVTTAVGSRYRVASGTSFAAPYVAAAAALLLELRPHLRAEELSGILQETSVDLGPSGWDPEYGTGRIDAASAVDFLGSSVIGITWPQNESELTLTDQPVTVIGSAYTALFARYSMYVGSGIEPQLWTQVVESDVAVLQSTLVRIPVHMLRNGDNVIRLVVHQKTGTTLESRVRIRITNADTLQVVHAEFVQAWENDRRVGVLTVEANRAVQLTCIRMQDTGEADTLVSMLRFARSHCITLDAEAWGTAGTVTVQCRAHDGQVAVEQLPYAVEQIAAPTTGWTGGNSGEFTGYVLNKVSNILDGGLPGFFMSDLSSGAFGPLTYVQRTGFTFTPQFQTSSIWIPRGFGDVNGNGRPNVFAGVVGRAVLFEQQQNGGNPFASVVFADTTNGRNAAGVADVDGDGTDDLIMISDSGCVVVSWKNGAWRELGKVTNPTPPAPGNAENRVDEISVAVGDFDGDGRTEIAFADNDGDMVIAEYTGTELRVEFVFTSVGIGGSGYVTSGDVDADGKPDILFGVPDDPYAGVNREYGRQVWTYRLFTSKEPDVYQNIWTDHIYGVRYGIGYRNGVELANVDERPGTELIVCAFPRLYVFTMSDAGSIQPILYKANVVTPRFLVYDFNGNGKPELGFGIATNSIGVMNNFSFIEYVGYGNRLATPAGLRAEMLAERHARLRWMPVPGARAYRIWWNSDGTGFFRISDSTGTTQFDIDSLALNRQYLFRVEALADVSAGNSERSAPVSVITGTQTQATEVAPLVVTTDDVAEGLRLFIRFSNSMPEQAPNASKFYLQNSSGSRVAVARSVVLAENDRLLVTFRQAEVEPGLLYCTMQSVPDALGIPTLGATIPIAVQESTQEPVLHLTGLQVVSATELVISYSEAVSESALLSGNYLLQPVGKIDAAERIAPEKIRLLLAHDQPLAALGKTYSVTVTNVVSENGSPITTGVGNTLSFVLTSEHLADVFVYPHPVHIERDAAVTFANLTLHAEIEILDQRFKMVRIVRETDGNGGVQWDLRDATGVQVPPGLYYYRVTGTTNGMESTVSGFRKLMIRR